MSLLETILPLWKWKCADIHFSLHRNMVEQKSIWRKICVESIIKVFCNSITNDIFGANGWNWRGKRGQNTHFPQLNSTQKYDTKNNAKKKIKCVWLSQIEHVFKSKTWCFVVAIIKFKYVWLLHCIKVFFFYLQVNNVRYTILMYSLSPFIWYLRSRSMLAIVCIIWVFTQITVQQQHINFIVFPKHLPIV